MIEGGQEKTKGKREGEVLLKGKRQKSERTRNSGEIPEQKGNIGVMMWTLGMKTQGSEGGRAERDGEGGQERRLR